METSMNSKESAGSTLVQFPLKTSAQWVRCFARIRGEEPIMFNPAIEEVLVTLPGGSDETRTARSKDKTLIADRVERLVPRNEKDEVGVPLDMVYACLRNGGKKVQFEGKTKVSTASSTLLPSFCRFPVKFFPFLDQEVKYRHDRRKANLNNGPKTTAICANRPAFDSWETVIEFDLDVRRCAPDIMVQVIQMAGICSGIGEWRPDRGGLYGKFELVEFKHEPYEKPAAESKKKAA